MGHRPFQLIISRLAVAHWCFDDTHMQASHRRSACDAGGSRWYAQYNFLHIDYDFSIRYRHIDLR